MHKLKIILVDDEPTIASITAFILRKSGHSVIEESNGLHALKTGEKHKWNLDLLITDINLPGVNGFDLAKKARKSNSALKIIYITGNCDAAEILKNNNEQNYELLRKPFGIEKITETISNLFGITG